MCNNWSLTARSNRLLTPCLRFEVHRIHEYTKLHEYEASSNKPSEFAYNTSIHHRCFSTQVPNLQWSLWGELLPKDHSTIRFHHVFPKIASPLTENRGLPFLGGKPIVLGCTAQAHLML